MSLTPSPFPQFAGQVNADVLANELLAVLSNNAVYGYAFQSSSGLGFNYYGGMWNDFPITAGSLALSASAMNSEGVGLWFWA